MKPAFSVIFLTTLIGAGQGLFIAIYGAEWLQIHAILEPSANGGAALPAAIALALLVAGLGASFFHLGHPERAWRAAAMWRTSWLSREVIALPLAMGLMFLYAAIEYLGWTPHLFMLGQRIPVDLSLLVGFFAMLAVIALFVCTAMIYSCLKFLRQWHSPLTVLNFFLMGLASGFTLAAVIAALRGDARFDYFAGVAIVLTLCAFSSRYASLARNRRLRSPSTLQSAIGVHHPTIRQLAQGAMGGSFNTRAFIHDYGPAVVRLARRFFLVAGFLLPVVLLWFGNPNAAWLVVLAFVAQYVGLLAERWYFFIEAEHPQNVYYRMIS